MIGTDASDDSKRTLPAQGDLRLLVTKTKGQPVAMLYRAVVPGTAEKDRVLFESPIGKVWFDRVEDINGKLQFAQDGGNVEFLVPLSALGFALKAGESFLADFGILRGDGTQTIQRLYWNNLNTNIVSDSPNGIGTITRVSLSPDSQTTSISMRQSLYTICCLRHWRDQGAYAPRSPRMVTTIEEINEIHALTVISNWARTSRNGRRSNILSGGWGCARTFRRQAGR